MATQTRPFMMTGVALASAAAIVAASPAMAPGIALPSSASLSAAKYELTTFADIFTVPSSEWIASYFQGYGGLLGPTGTPPVANPYAPMCSNNCYASGVNGLVYLAADALINGNGKGWSDASAWPISAVNYYFEGAAGNGGFTPFVQYVTYNVIDKLPSSVASALSTLMSLVFAGPPLVSQVFDTVLSTAAGLIDKIPTVGPYIAGGIYAFIGQNGYTPGLTGLVNYVINVVTGNVKPTASTAATSAAAVAAPAAAVPSAVSRALTSAKAASVAAPTVTVAAPNAAAAATASPATAVSAARSAASTPAASGSTATSSATADASTGSSSAASGATSSAGTSRSHPVRDAVQKAAKQIASALAGAKAGSAASTGAAK